jgi:large subunit ribosomal protein L6
MSRIGKLPITVPPKVKVTLNGVHIKVEGPAGSLERDLHPAMAVKLVDGKVVVERKTDDRLSRSLHGLTRTLIDNMVRGVSEPFKKSLEITGVGYRAELESGNVLKLQVGYSHDVRKPLDASIKCTIDKQVTIHLSSPNKEVLGQTAAEIRAYRPCEPYKGKGIKYAGEKVRRKEGKTGAG